MMFTIGLKRSGRGVVVSLLAAALLTAVFVVAPHTAEAMPCVGSPINDDFGCATAVSSSLPQAVSGSSVAATMEVSEDVSTCATDPTLASVWWSWTPSTSETVSLNTVGSDFDTVLAVWSGSILGSLTEEVCDYQASSNDAMVSLVATAGTTYWIQVHGEAQATGLAQLSISPRPCNDDFACAAPIGSALPQSVFSDSTLATEELAEQRSSCFDDAPIGSLWWSWTPTVTESAAIDTFGSDFDTVVAVWTGSTLASLTEVGCNDQSNSNQSKMAVDAVAGTTYWIQVYGWSGDSGSVQLNVSKRPCNDDLSCATVLGTALPQTGVGSSVLATEETDEQRGSCFDDAPIGSVWWSWTPAVSEPVSIDTFGSDFDTVLAVWTGSAIGALDEETCNDQSSAGSQSEVFFNAIAGTTYLIQVYGWFGAEGTVSLNMDSYDRPEESGFVPLNPERILDTRETADPWGPGEIRALDLVGVAGVPNDATVTAVAANVTSLTPTTNSALRIAPSGEAFASAGAAKNFGIGSDRADLTNDLLILPVGLDGKVQFKNNAGTTHFTVDVVGYFTANGGSQYESVNPERVLDTRQTRNPWGPGETRRFDPLIAGQSASCITAVAAHITSLNPTTNSALRVAPSGTSFGSAGTAKNFGTTNDRSALTNNLVFLPLGPDGLVQLRNNDGTTHFTVDVVGAFSRCQGDHYVAVNPSRIVDTRVTVNPWTAGEIRNVMATGVATVPSDGSVSAVAAHITSIAPSSNSAIRVAPAGSAFSTNGTVKNFGIAADRAALTNNLVFLPIGSNGEVQIKNNNGDTHLTIDVVGYFADCTLCVAALAPAIDRQPVVADPITGRYQEASSD